MPSDMGIAATLARVKALAGALRPAEPEIDPLRRVFVPLDNDQGFSRTHDGVIYHRDAKTHVLRRAFQKVRGKAARRADKRARRHTRISAQAAAAAALLEGQSHEDQP